MLGAELVGSIVSHFILSAGGAAQGLRRERLAPAPPSLAETPACDRTGQNAPDVVNLEGACQALLRGAEAVPCERPILKAISLIAFVISENKLNHPSVSGQKSVCSAV